MIDGLLGALTPTCDVPGCDRDPEPLWVKDGVALLCPEHTVEVLLRLEDGGPA